MAHARVIPVREVAEATVTHAPVSRKEAARRKKALARAMRAEGLSAHVRAESPIWATLREEVLAPTYTREGRGYRRIARETRETLDAISAING